MSSESWDSVWTGMKDIGFERENYTWSIYESLLGRNYDYRGKRVVEIGCGTGISTCMMAKRGADVTFLDYSRDALRIVKRVMKSLDVDGELVLGDAFDADLRGFDISHSEGVIEHFRGEQRQGIVDVHASALKRGGRCVITVPQIKSPPYRIGKFLAERTGTWIHGNEYPYSRTELRKRMERSGLMVGKMMGGEFLFSFGWAFAPLWMGGRVLSWSIGMPRNRKISRLNYDNFLANRFGRVIAAVGIKK